MPKLAAYTLLEVLLVVALSAILLSFAVPSYNSFISRARSQRYLASVIDAMEFARQEAIKRSSIITLCPVDTEQHCIDSKEWLHGYVVYFNPNQQDQPEQNVDILRYYPAPNKSATFSRNGQQENINILADGSLNAQQKTFSYKDANNLNANWELILNSSGRLKIEVSGKVNG